MLIKLCRGSLISFAKILLPHLFRLSFSRAHEGLFKWRIEGLLPVSFEREGIRLAIAAPRGHGKSTINTLFFLLHDLAYEMEKYIVIFSATLPQAEQRLKNLRRELEKNAVLRLHYGHPLTTTGARNARSLLVGDTLIEAYSAGTEVRGISFGPWRPTKIVLDDVEDSDGVENPLLRERLYDWFREVVENLGDRYTHIHVVGTVLHPDSLLAQLLERPDFTSIRWRAIEHFAERQDLWQEWTRRYTDLQDARRVDHARRYFNANKEAMLQGAQVLWEQKEDYYQLMTQLATRGRRAFFKEKQNEPVRGDHSLFDPATFRWFRRQGDRLVFEECGTAALGCVQSNDDTPFIPLSSLRIFGFLDAALGRHTRPGDYAAIATVGIDPNGCLYVLDIWLERATPSEQARRIFAQHALWNYSLFGIEDVGFQGLMAEPIETVRKELRASGGRHDLILRPIAPRGSKRERVAALEPLIHNGWLRFERSLPEEFLAQLEQFPSGRHDDGPDALTAAVELARNPTTPIQLLNKRRISQNARVY